MDSYQDTAFNVIVKEFEDLMTAAVNHNWKFQTAQWIAAEQLYEIIKTNDNGGDTLINMPTGKGKTHMLFFYIFMKKALGQNYRSLIIVEHIREEEVLRIAIMLGFRTIGVDDHNP